MNVLEELKSMTEERFLSLYEDLAQSGFGPLDSEVAKDLRFRPQAIRKLPMNQRSRRAKHILVNTGNAELCYELFGSWLIAQRKDLVTGFLDATGVPHEDGMLQDLDANQPAPAKLEAAVTELEGKFGAEDVNLYLALCTEQWPGLKELEELWRSRAAAAAS